MERQAHNNAGDSGFYHFFGVVEDRNDPKKHGRLRVRIYGKHSESLSELPTEHLPWAQIAMPLNAGAATMADVWDGQLVFGFFADGIEQQIPIITHKMIVDGEVNDPEGKKQTGFQDQRETKPIKLPDGKTQAAKGINKSVQNNPDNYGNSLQKKTRKENKLSVKGFSEPDDSFGGTYPYVHSKETESGHVIEFNDSPGKERLYVFHRSGSYVEITNDGTVNVKGKGDVNVMASKTVNIASGAATNVYVGGSCNMKISDSLNIDAGKDITIKSGGNVNIKGSRINLN